MIIKWSLTIALNLLLSVGLMAEDSKEILVTSHTQEIKHNDKSGGKGIDPIVLVAPQTTANICAAFSKASIQYTKRRYGVAKLVALPKRQCSPVKEDCKFDVNWKHSPAGGVDYKIQVTWDLVSCK